MYIYPSKINDQNKYVRIPNFPENLNILQTKKLLSFMMQLNQTLHPKATSYKKNIKIHAYLNYLGKRPCYVLNQIKTKND